MVLKFDNMKTNELMIGDWILMPNGNNYEKIVAIPTNTQIEVSGNCWINPMACIPIPITVKILEKNGYYGVGTARGINGFIGDGSDITIDNVGNGNFNLDISLNTWTNDNCISITIKYVHELQHALRICGLSDLADDFKI